MGSLILASDRDIKLVQQTAAKDLTPCELDHFVHMCRAWELDPLRRQIYALVYSKDNPKKRRVSYITGIDGYRAIADRTGCYRPGPRSVERDETLQDDALNPKGIASAKATVFKFAQGAWHEFTEEVEWDEFAPTEQIWAEGDDGRRRPTGKYKLPEMWMRMGVNQIKKCVEAQALRRGWPDNFSGLYVDAEMDQSRMSEMIDITPHEQAQRADADERRARIGGPAVLFDLIDGEPLQALPVGKIHDRLVEWLSDHTDEDGKTDADKVRLFQTRNVEALRQFWSHDDGAALDIKKRFAALRLTKDEAA